MQMQMSCCSRPKWAEFQQLACVSSPDYLKQTSTKMSETGLRFMFKLESDNDVETQEEVTTSRMQQDVSECLVDEFMLLMWS